MLLVSDLAKSYTLRRHWLTRRWQGNLDDPRVLDGAFHTFREVSFHLEPGEVMGLLGPNGAGKTTLIRCLSSALTPTAGSIQFEGTDIQQIPLKVRQNMGVMSGVDGLYRRLTVRENLTYFGRLYKMTSQQIFYRIKELAEQLDIAEFLDQRVGFLSTGMRQRAAIARSVVHRPRLMIFDEPTTGLDILASEQVLNFIAQMKAEGTAIIFCTHHMDEVELLCDKLLVLNGGQGRDFDSLQAAMQHTGMDNLHQALICLLDQTRCGGGLC